MNRAAKVRITGRWLTNGNIHGRLLIQRNGVYSCCGVMQLRRDEWLVLVSLAHQHGIEIQTERGDPVPVEEVA